MGKTPKPAGTVSADTITQLADQGKDVSRFFKGRGRMVRPAIPVTENVGQKPVGSAEALAPPMAIYPMPIY
jgi:hypothetical protein